MAVEAWALGVISTGVGGDRTRGRIPLMAHGQVERRRGGQGDGGALVEPAVDEVVLRGGPGVGHRDRPVTGWPALRAVVPRRADRTGGVGRGRARVAVKGCDSAIAGDAGGEVEDRASTSRGRDRGGASSTVLEAVVSVGPACRHPVTSRWPPSRVCVGIHQFGDTDRFVGVGQLEIGQQPAVRRHVELVVGRLPGVGCRPLPPVRMPVK